jgi:hypothetical protein
MGGARFDEGSGETDLTEERNQKQGEKQIEMGMTKNKPGDSVEKDKNEKRDKDERPRTGDEKMTDELMTRSEMKSEIKKETGVTKTGRRWKLTETN